MNKYSIMPEPLVDIMMYGGDTQPWEVSLMNGKKKAYTAGELTEVECVLDVLPFTQSVFLDDSVLDTPVLSKTGGISDDEYGHAVATFSFLPEDTIEMRGKYIYQLSVQKDKTIVRVSQGKLTILPNVNRRTL